MGNGRKQGKGEPETSPRIVEATIRQAKALKLRIEGKSLDEIAEALGYAGRQGAFNAIVSGLQKTLQEPSAELRTLELERLDCMLKAVWSKVEEGDNAAIATALRVSERRAKLVGLDAPTKVDLGPLVRQWAEAEGLDPAELLAEVEKVQSETQG